MTLLFGTGGVPLSPLKLSTVDGIRRVAQLGLGCMELEFVRGVKMGEAAAQHVAEAAAAEKIKLSAHAPYFINLNAHDPAKITASKGYILQTARIAAVCGAGSIVFHPAFYLGDPPEKTFQAVKSHLADVMTQLRRENNPVRLRLEVMGKPTSFGTLAEVLRVCTELEGAGICVDFAHLHAYNGESNTYPEFCTVLENIRQHLGEAALGDMHLHISGIAFSKKGETKHLDLEDSDLRYHELLRALKEYKVGGLAICESPSLENDALRLQETYAGL
jgi:deoxyribonuclease IV